MSERICQLRAKTWIEGLSSFYERRNTLKKCIGNSRKSIHWFSCWKLARVKMAEIQRLEVLWCRFNPFLIETHSMKVHTLLYQIWPTQTRCQFPLVNLWPHTPEHTFHRSPQISGTSKRIRFWLQLDKTGPKVLLSFFPFSVTSESIANVNKANTFSTCVYMAMYVLLSFGGLVVIFGFK